MCVCVVGGEGDKQASDIPGSLGLPPKLQVGMESLSHVGTFTS